MPSRDHIILNWAVWLFDLAFIVVGDGVRGRCMNNMKKESF